MNKQDKIKKVMREFKDGKLKTPNGEVVTDKKQALAIAMSESEDYAEKADLIEDISISSLSHAEDVIKSIGSEELFEKARSGTYADTAENRKLGRVGQKYGEVKRSERGEYRRGKKLLVELPNMGEVVVSYVEQMMNPKKHMVKYNDKKYIITEDKIKNDSPSSTRKINETKIKSQIKELNIRLKELRFEMEDDPNVSPEDDSYSYRVYGKEMEKIENKIANLRNKLTSNKTEVRKAVDDEMGISDAYRELFGDDLEKAHQDGDMHPNGKWVWVSSANGGKGDWRTLNGRAHKKHSETQASNKFLENFKNASDDVLDKIVSGKIQAVDREKKLAQQILDSRKKSTQKKLSSIQNFHVQKLIDTYKISKNSYTDTSKMSIVITPKGNWNLRYDGKDVSTISGQRNIMDRKTLEDAGIKFEDPKKRPVGAGTNGPTPKTKADKKVK